MVRIRNVLYFGEISSSCVFAHLRMPGVACVLENTFVVHSFCMSARPDS